MATSESAENVIVVDDTPSAPSAPSGSDQQKIRKTNSVVWADFEKVAISKTAYVAKCKYCKKTLTAGGKAGTSHLRYHLSKCSLARIEKRKQATGQDAKQQMLQSMSLNKKNKDMLTINELKNWAFDQDKSRSDLTDMIIMHEYPLSMVDHFLFRRFVRNLQPLFHMCTRNTIRSDIFSSYERERVKLYKYFESTSARLSFTADMWTSGQNKGYMALTCHFIDDAWKIQKRIINFVHVRTSHTADMLAKIIIEKLLTWNIDKKIMCFVFDNATVNDALCRILVSTFNADGLLLDNGDFVHVRCAAHIINLIVQDGVNEIKDVIYKIRESAKYVKGSPQRAQVFQDVCAQVKAPKTMVVQDCPTRWNSTYKMLESMLGFKDAFTRYAKFDDNYKNLPSPEEWKAAEMVCEALKVFYLVTKEFSGTEYTTSNIYFNHVCRIHVLIKKWCASDMLFLSTMAKKMLPKFEKYWKDTCKILSIACILDPRFKMKTVEYYFPMIYGYGSSTKINEISHCLHNIYHEYSLHSININDTFMSGVGSTNNPSIGSIDFSHSIDSATNLNSQESVGNDNEADSSLEFGLSQFLEAAANTQPTKNDLEIYLDEAVFPIQKGVHFDVLAWWKSNAPKYPILARVAKDVLGIPVSTVASEAAFSTAGRVLDEYRCSMTPELVERLICSQDWLRCEIKEQEMEAKAMDALGTIFSGLNVKNEEVEEETINVV